MRAPNPSFCAAQPAGRSGDGPHLSAPGRRFCTACHQELNTALSSLPTAYTQSEAALLPHGVSSVRKGGKDSRPTGISLNEEVITFRSDLIAVLASWADLVVNERSTSKPTARRPDALVPFLLIHLDWLAAHPAAGEFAEEIRQLTRRAHHVIHNRHHPVVRIGNCLHPDCDAPINTLASPAGSQGLLNISCTAGHSWKPHEWLLLHKQLQQSDQSPVG